MKTNQRVQAHRSAQNRRLLDRLRGEALVREYARREYLIKLNREYPLSVTSKASGEVFLSDGRLLVIQTRTVTSSVPVVIPPVLVQTFGR